MQIYIIHPKTSHSSNQILIPGVLCHHWYRVLDNFLPGRTLRTIVVKIAWDQVTLPDAQFPDSLRSPGRPDIPFQVLFSPICIAACIFVSGAVFEAKSSTQIVSQRKKITK